MVNLASNIKYLRLNNNLFTSISASRLPSALKELDISNNQISSYLSAVCGWVYVVQACLPW